MATNMNDMWVTASGNFENELQNSLVLEARLEATQYWPVLAASQSPQDFQNRIALIDDQITSVARKTTQDQEGQYSFVRKALVKILTNDFRTVHEARKQKESARAKRSQAHAKKLQREVLAELSKKAESRPDYDKGYHDSYNGEHVDNRNTGYDESKNGNDEYGEGFNSGSDWKDWDTGGSDRTPWAEPTTSRGASRKNKDSVVVNGKRIARFQTQATTASRRFLAGDYQGDRAAKVNGGASSLEQVQNYMPSNYTASQDPDGTIWISGHDSAGWTLDGYVIPRLASGLIFATEIPESAAAFNSTASRQVTAWNGHTEPGEPRTGPCATCGADCYLSGTDECPDCVGKSIHDTLHPQCKWTTPGHHHATAAYDYASNGWTSAGPGYEKGGVWVGPAETSMPEYGDWIVHYKNGTTIESDPFQTEDEALAFAQSKSASRKVANAYDPYLNDGEEFSCDMCGARFDHLDRGGDDTYGGCPNCGTDSHMFTIVDKTASRKHAEAGDWDSPQRNPRRGDGDADDQAARARRQEMGTDYPQDDDDQQTDNPSYTSSRKIALMDAACVEGAHSFCSSPESCDCECHSPRKVAYTSDGSDITPGAAAVMDAVADIVPNGESALHYQTEIAAAVAPFKGNITQEDLDCLTDYNYHTERNALTSSRKTAYTSTCTHCGTGLHTERPRTGSPMVWVDNKGLEECGSRLDGSDFEVHNPGRVDTPGATASRNEEEE